MSLACLVLLAAGSEPLPGDPPVDGLESTISEGPSDVLSQLLGSGGVDSTFRYGALLRAFFSDADDSISTSDEPIRGVGVRDAEFWGELRGEGWSARVSVDGAGPSGDSAQFVLEDGYATFRWSEELEITAGSFKPRVLRSGSTDPAKLLFADRTVLGGFFDRYDLGAELHWNVDQFDFRFAGQNGPTGQRSVEDFYARLDWQQYDPGLDLYSEGARGAGDQLSYWLGLTYFERAVEGSPKDNRGYAIDIASTLGPWSGAFEWLRLKDGPGGAVESDGHVGLQLIDNAAIYALTVGCMLNDHWQLAGRYQRIDDAFSTQAKGVALNYFPDDGPLAWVIDYTDYTSDGPDGAVINAGVHFGASR